MGKSRVWARISPGPRRAWEFWEREPEKALTDLKNVETSRGMESFGARYGEGLDPTGTGTRAWAADAGHGLVQAHGLQEAGGLGRKQRKSQNRETPDGSYAIPNLNALRSRVPPKHDFVRDGAFSCPDRQLARAHARDRFKCMLMLQSSLRESENQDSDSDPMRFRYLLKGIR